MSGYARPVTGSKRDVRLPVVCLLLLLATGALYWPVSHYGLTGYDDPEYITLNVAIQHGLTWPGLKWAFTTGYASNWHPLTWLSYMADYQFFGGTAGALHLTNVIFHLANSLLVLLVVRGMTGELWPSALAAALFALHPLRVESVAWVCERKDVLSAFSASSPWPRMCGMRVFQAGHFTFSRCCFSP